MRYITSYAQCLTLHSPTHIAQHTINMRKHHNNHTSPYHNNHILHSIKDVIRSFGVVFGDIGTSPIYTISATFFFIPVTLNNVLGVLSLIIWTLTLIITVQYVWLAMSLNCQGEGGTIILRETLLRLVIRRSVAVKIVALLSFLGLSLSIGDSIITPAISILSAVEGMSLIPQFAEHLGDTTIISISCALIVMLFSIQHKGVEKVGTLFGPVMILWFILLGFTGCAEICSHPVVLTALNPIHGIRYICNHGVASSLVLSNIILCATGGEALFADMGHLGKRPITHGWIFISIALALNYLGQGAFLLSSLQNENVFFGMILSLMPSAYPMFVLLSTITTIIASQAAISSIYSVCFQSISIKILPRMRMKYTSLYHKSQIYIPIVNWLLMAAVIFIILVFRQSTRLSAAYGLAMSCTMSITGIFLTWIFMVRKEYGTFSVSLLITLIDFLFLVSGMGKLPYGGYWSLILASIPFSLIVLYAAGQQRLYKYTKPVSMRAFVDVFNKAYCHYPKIQASAVFLVRDSMRLPIYVYKTMIVNRIIYEDNILISLQKRDHPFSLEYDFDQDIAPGLRHFTIYVGYMTRVDIGKIFAEVGISPSAVFYGIDEIETENFFWGIFAFIKKITPSFVKFYKLPVEKLHGVLMNTKM